MRHVGEHGDVGLGLGRVSVVKHATGMAVCPRPGRCLRPRPWAAPTTTARSPNAPDNTNSGSGSGGSTVLGGSGRHRSVRITSTPVRFTGRVITRLLRRPVVLVAVVVLMVSGGIGLYWFQPWKVVTDRQANETLAIPPVVPLDSVAPPQTSAPAPGPALVRQGEFISHEHATTGQARVIMKPDGSHLLELVGLDTSNGPDLRVWLSDQPVRSGSAGWDVFDDGKWVELGRLKGNQGDQAYPIPADTDLDQLASVAIWCKRFSVSFGAAGLTPPA